MKKFVFILILFCGVSYMFAATSPMVPRVSLNITAPRTPTDLVSSLNILVILTILVLAPSLVLVATSFTRFVVVFGFLRHALGTGQTPPTQILISLAMILTYFVMEPVGREAYVNGIKPYMAKKIGYEQAFTRTVKPFKKFMLRNTREKDLALFYRIRGLSNPKNVDDVQLSVLLPAYMISELKTAFQISFLIFLPFLVIDMVISSILMSMGMMMLPPVMISLPFKILVFILVDGWNLLIMNLVKSIN